MHAVVAFSAHHVIAADVDEEVVRRRLPRGDLGAPMSASFLLFLAGWLGAEPGTLDRRPRAGPTGSQNRAIELWVARRPGRPSACRGGLGGTDPTPLVYADRRTRRTRRRARGRARRRRSLGDGVRGGAERTRTRARSPAGGHGARRLCPTASRCSRRSRPATRRRLRACLAAGYVAIGAEVLFVRPGPLPDLPRP